MFINAETLSNEHIHHSQIIVVGTGPAGTVLALELAGAGFEVALVESGCLKYNEVAQNLGEASYLDPKHHAPMSHCTRMQLGGTSNIWGGRCLPYDPVDFDKRPYIHCSDWPVQYEELERYFQKACDYFFCGSPQFNIQDIKNITQKTIVPGLPDTQVLTSTLERWSLPTNFGREYFNELKKSDKITVIYGLTCTDIETNEQGNSVILIHGRTIGGKNIYLKGQKYLIAGGALNTTRLLLNSDSKHPGGIGNHSGLLGKFYMGHLSGDIATVRFKTNPRETAFDFDHDLNGIYLRRRFSFTRQFLHEKQLPNIVAWLGSPRFGEASHQSGVLSSAYLALSMPILKKVLTSTAMREAAVGHQDQPSLRPHIENIFKDLRNVVSFIPSFGYKRFIAKRKIPGLFVYSAANEYPLHYHGEQVPNESSKVSLSDEYDELGMRKLNINLRFTQQDIEGVIRAHDFWDEHIKKYDCGYLKYTSNDLQSSVYAQAKDGFHQVGTTRMSKDPGDGVVDTDSRVHGFNNLYISSSSTFVTSGQANSTFMIVAFALRLADHLKYLGLAV